jgi:methyl-accepting chemotaxis protein
VYWRFAERAQLELADAARNLEQTTSDIEHVSGELAHSADTQAMSIDMINDSLAELETRVQQTSSQADPALVASISQIVEAVRMMTDLTDQHSRTSERAASATKALTAQARHLNSLVANTR